ncbi:MAG: hypothetical protein A2X22_05405 [Bacteroidetes bacterium GWF2_49_14]|nr:MAG: hypothetical protein A2X22_05405 [Bacteroidetes bacterium GWF2_49_14]HBB93626.1 hypothetical protein [Bacteroidales bacterium]
MKFSCRLIIIQLFLAIGFTALPGQFQPTAVKKSDNLVTVNGKDFYLHEVHQGHTLYSIAKAYGVTEASITEANSVLRTKSLAIGLVIKVPALPSAREEFLIHIVQEKETLSSLSRQYGIKVDDIRMANPDSRWGLSVGQKVKIPKDKITIRQEATGQTTAPARNEAAEKEKELPVESSGSLPCGSKAIPHKTDVFNLVILLPLNLAENDTISYSDTLETDHFRFFEFLEGAYLAIDSLRQSGLNMNLTVLDTERNPETVRNIISSGKLNDADLIIGPVFRSELELVAPFANSRQIPLVNPLSSIDFASGNPYVFQTRLKPEQQVQKVTEYLGSHYKSNVLVIGRYAERNDPDFLSLFDQLKGTLAKADPSGKARPKLVYFNETSRNFLSTESGGTSLEAYLSGNQPNYVIISSNYEVFTTDLINQLNSKSTHFEISAFSLYPSALGSLDLENLFNVNLEVFSDLEENPFVDYHDPAVQNFCRLYGTNWSIEPSRFSFQGFDLTYYFTSALFYFGRNLTETVPCWSEFFHFKPMQTPLFFISGGNGNGFENQAIPIIRYSKAELNRKRVH